LLHPGPFVLFVFLSRLDWCNASTLKLHSFKQTHKPFAAIEQRLIFFLEGSQQLLPHCHGLQSWAFLIMHIMHHVLCHHQQTDHIKGIIDLFTGGITLKLVLHIFTTLAQDKSKHLGFVFFMLILLLEVHITIFTPHQFLLFVSIVGQLRNWQCHLLQLQHQHTHQLATLLANTLSS